jgi:uncharacterized protein YkwD
MARTPKALAAAAAAAAVISVGSVHAQAGGGCADPGPAAPSAAQKSAMLCLVNSARSQHGLAALHLGKALAHAALEKAHAIVSCEVFSHTPCGRSFASTFVDVGYTKGRWAVGENLAWGTGDRGSASASIEGFLHSPPHRANLLGHWQEIGIALWQGTLFGETGVSLWVLDFGRRS